ncbi:REF/SRPP-like protein [Zea mays]|uniref:REF/SRPP-like protein n=1 Tax=Zea mays TaxID=4577 RepID=A0A1D6F454_MAIZE|nr:REF/SRPP-like protein [Zea mays]
MAEDQTNPSGPAPASGEEREVVVEHQQEEPRRRAPKLRYLDFVQVAAAQAAVCIAALYGLAKDHAGPLRPGVDAVESAVKGVVGPVCGLPLDVLAFVDRKIVVPTAAHWAEKYNRAVATAADHGYAGATYLPTIPTKRIAKRSFGYSSCSIGWHRVELE